MERKNKLLLMFISLFIFFCPIVAKADVTNYDVWVGETQVNSDNKDNIDGSNRVSYDPTGNTLTLNNFNYAGESEGKTFESNNITYHAAIYAEGNLNIYVTGDSALIPTLPNTGGNYGIYVDGDLNINGLSGQTLTIGVSESLEDNYGIYASGSFGMSLISLSVNSGNSTNSNSYGIYADSMTFLSTTSNIVASKSYANDSSGLITSSGGIHISDSTVTSIGGIVSGLNDSKSYGMKSAATIVADGTSEVIARGGSANSSNELTQNNNSYGVYAYNIILDGSALFKAYAGNSSRCSSYGLYALTQLTLTDEAEYHSSGYTKAMNVAPTYSNYGAYVITFSDVNQQHQENRGYNDLDPTAFDTAKYVKIKPAALVNFANDAVITWDGLTNEEISYGIVYDGTVKTPSVHVMYDGYDMVENVDYTLEYDSGRTNVGSYKVYVHSIGFDSTATKTFSIRPAEIDSLAINQNILPYNGQAQSPNETVQSGSIVLSTDDYDIIYYSGTVVLEENQIDYTRVRDVGAYTLLIKAKGNFTGELSTVFYIDTVVISNANTTITFDSETFDYTGNTIRPIITVTTNGGTLINGVDYEVIYPASSTDIGNYEITINGINNYEGTMTKSYSIVKATIGELVLSNDEYTYNGSIQVPTVAVTKGDQVLVKDTDYTLVYSNDASVNHGTYTITATGINNYEGVLQETYVINKAPITDLVLDDEEFTYNGTVQTPNISVTSNGVTLTENTDYELTLPEGRINAGEYTITATGINNYEGTLEKTYTIYAKAITDVDFSTEEFTYDGTVQTPTVTVYSFGETLTEGTDYELTLPEGRINAGEYSITITGINNYQGTIQKSYVINPKMITEAYLDQTEYTYDGTAHRPTETVKSDDVVLTTDDYDINFYVGATQIPVDADNMVNAGSYMAIVEGKGNYIGHFQLPFSINPISITGEGVTIELDEEHYYYTGENVHPTVTVKNGDNVLVRNEDYEIVYPAESTELNTYLIIVRGMNNYSGQVEVPFTVEPAPIYEEDITLNPSVLTYTGTNIRPEVVIVKNNRTLVEGTDYDVTYPDVSIELGTYTITVTGKGNYTGTVEVTYRITAARLASEDITLSNTAYTYDGKVHKPSVTVKFGTRVLTEGTDYTVSYSNHNSVNAGTYDVIITGIGNYTGSIKKTYKINPKKITEVTLSSTRFTYIGKERLPDVRVKSGTTILSSYHYNVSYSKGRIKIGTYTVTVTGKGNYTGSVKLSYIIVPKTTKIKSLTPGSKKVKVTWKKGTKGITDGYQIRYSKKSNFSKSKYKNIKGQKKYKKTIKKLKKNKKYYFQIRTYKVVSGKKYYSDWSKTKKAKTK